MIDLTGKLLIAMPGMGDPRFEYSVVFICSYEPEGAMGLIINKPAQDVSLSDLLKQLDITPTTPKLDHAVHYGGPVEGVRGFVLHSRDYESRNLTMAISDDFGMTATLDVLEDIAQGTGPKRVLMMLGYAGWGPGQLDAEILRNGWLMSDADADLVFDCPEDTKWSSALKGLGVDPLGLSSEAGRA